MTADRAYLPLLLLDIAWDHQARERSEPEAAPEARPTAASA